LADFVNIYDGLYFEKLAFPNELPGGKKREKVLERKHGAGPRIASLADFLFRCVILPPGRLFTGHKVLTLNHLQISCTALKEINSLSPNISMRIFLTVLYIFLMVLVGRICIKLRQLVFDDHFLNSHDLYV